MKQARHATEQAIHELLSSNAEWACFRNAVPMIGHIQKAAMYDREFRSYQNKYPAEAGQAFRALAQELLDRIGLSR
jgi:hypothetical protein